MNSSLQFLLQGNFSRQSSCFTNPNSDFCYIRSARPLCSRWLSPIWMRKCLQTESQRHPRTYFMLYAQLRNCSLAPFIQSLKGIILYNLSCLIIIYADFIMYLVWDHLAFYEKQLDRLIINCSLTFSEINSCTDYIFYLPSCLILGFFKHF